LLPPLHTTLLSALLFARSLVVAASVGEQCLHHYLCSYYNLFHTNASPFPSLAGMAGKHHATTTFAVVALMMLLLLSSALHTTIVAPPFDVRVDTTGAAPPLPLHLSGHHQVADMTVVCNCMCNRPRRMQEEDRQAGLPWCVCAFGNDALITRATSCTVNGRSSKGEGGSSPPTAGNAVKPPDPPPPTYFDQWNEGRWSQRWKKHIRAPWGSNMTSPL
jgi:hypothetical protein